jgi:GrpB-like predicted nucleotidyltransferase (UPF0157 family)
VHAIVQGCCGSILGMAETPGGADFVRPRAQHNATIHLAEPDPAWPEQYAGEAAKIRAALDDRALLVEHTGSTSVPGLLAKPVIDIVLLVADPADEASYVPDLEAAGFLLHLREPGWHEHRLLRGTDPAVNLHVFAVGSPEAERMLLFRDRLRTHPDELERYAAAKRELAARQWAVVQDYADAKTEVVEAIIARARG